MDWQAEAERLKFNDGRSWTEVYQAMKPHFPELSDKQIEEKVRGVLRRSKQYKTETQLPVIQREITIWRPKTTTFRPVGDLHVGAPTCQIDAAEKYISTWHKNDIAFWMGDLIDNATIGSKGSTYLQTMTPQEQKRYVIRLLRGTPSEGAINGNHCERTFRATGQDPMEDICTALNIPYCGYDAYITIHVGDQTYTAYATHDIGKSENALKQKARVFDVDIVLGAHIHQPKIIPVAKKLYGGKQKDTIVCICNAWLCDEPYALKYDPVSMRIPTLTLHADKHQIDCNL